VSEESEEQADLSTFAAGSDADADADADSDSDSDERRRATPDAVPDVREMDASERIELALDLLAHLEADELALSDVVDRIETVTTNPTLTREILDAAELRGVIEREGGRIRTRRGGTYVRFDRQVVEREGEFDCRRCGASISTGHFVRFDAGELGPFGSSCVRKVLGRE
jgi:hypothetical protein